MNMVTAELDRPCTTSSASKRYKWRNENVQKPSETMQLVIKKYSEPIRVTLTTSRALPVARRGDLLEIRGLSDFGDFGPIPQRF